MEKYVGKNKLLSLEISKTITFFYDWNIENNAFLTKNVEN